MSAPLRLPMDDSRKTIRVLIFHPLALFRATLSQFLASNGFEVVGECETLDQVLESLNRSAPQVILIDSDLYTEAGDLASITGQRASDSYILLLAGSLDPRKAAVALKTGASGILLKSEPPERLVQAIHALAAGGTWIDQRIIQVMAGELVDRAHGHVATPTPLDDRERAVLHGIIQGLSNRAIGETIRTSESSVKNIVQRLFAKGGVKTRSLLVRIALQGQFGAIERFRNDDYHVNRGPADLSATPRSGE